MPCHKPLTAWKAASANSSGKTSLVFSPARAAQPDDPIEVACGQCIGCRLKRSKDWAIRCMHESSLHEKNCFITLTFSEEKLWARENPGSIDIRDIQTFIKRLRNHINRSGDKAKLRYFACGEYGDKTLRPHYHILLFNYEPDDLQLWRNGQNPLYTSPTIERIWGNGYAPIGNVTFDSAAYVARYCLKKVNGELKDDTYTWVDKATGEIHPRDPEFATMSRRPGIGKDWILKHGQDVFRDDYVIVKGKKVHLPKYYDKIHEELDPLELEHVKDQRLVKHLSLPHKTEERRADIHYAAHKKDQSFIREVQEDETNRIHHLRQQSTGIPPAVLHAKRRNRH